MKNMIIAAMLLGSVLVAQNRIDPPVKINSVSAFAGMGVNLVSASDMVAYINATSTFAQRVDDFGVAVDFFGGMQIPVDDEWAVTVEHTYLFKSYTFSATTGATIDLFYSFQAPSIIIQRMIAGPGYFISIGAGGGYHFGNASQTISTFGTETNYTAKGIGVKSEIVGQTAFDDHVYGYIGGEIGWEFLGTLKDEKGAALGNTIRKQNAGLDLYFAGIRFGVIYKL